MCNIIAVCITTHLCKNMLPAVGNPPEIKVEMSPENIERGYYLANHVMVCMDCHSKGIGHYFQVQLLQGLKGKGEVFDQKTGFPGKYISSNITPYNLGKWSDGEIFRAITTGVSKDGRALFSIMPYHNFGQLDVDDIAAVIAYIRSIEPIKMNLKNQAQTFR